MGQVRPVLIEKSRTAGLFHGFTDNYIKIEAREALKDNEIIPMQLGPWNDAGDALYATAAGASEKKEA